MNVLSLFSGIGGLDLGLERAGMTVVGHVEIDPFCQQVLAKHWPEVPQHDDVRTAPAWWATSARPRVHVVAGGFPCQGHSVAGKQLGTDDERWGWPWFRDVIDALNPPLVLIENVPHLTRTGLLDVLKDLADRGFDAWWVRVPAAALGAPHLRWRLFTFAAHPERVELRIEPGRGGWADWSRTTLAGFDGAQWSLADPSGVERGTGRQRRPTLPGQPRDELAAAGLGDQCGADAGAAFGTWSAEPDVGRVADGVPARVDRLRGLGNAVVPQVAEYIGRLVLASVATLRETAVAA